MLALNGRRSSPWLGAKVNCQGDFSPLQNKLSKGRVSTGRGGREEVLLSRSLIPAVGVGKGKLSRCLSLPQLGADRRLYSVRKLEATELWWSTLINLMPRRISGQIDRNCDENDESGEEKTVKDICPPPGYCSRSSALRNHHRGHLHSVSDPESLTKSSE